MRTLTPAELASMRGTQVASLPDTCIILAYTATEDGYNLPDVTHTAGDPVACGLEHLRPMEIQDTGQVPVITARLRLAITETVDPKDRIKVTHRNGSALATPQLFDIVGPVRFGPSGLVLDLATATVPTTEA